MLRAGLGGWHVKGVRIPYKILLELLVMGKVTIMGDLTNGYLRPDSMLIERLLTRISSYLLVEGVI